MVPHSGARAAQRLEGPIHILDADIDALNVLFSDAFSERYRRDGLVGVRVPPLNPAIWRYAIKDAGEGAMLWRDSRGAIAAFNIAHRSGVEGWMGPLAVRDDFQGGGHGKAVVRAGIDWLRAAGCTVIGLETMPRTIDNIGFYAGLGFTPTRLTITLSMDAAPAPCTIRLLSELQGAAQLDAVAAVGALVDGMLPGYDFSREIQLTRDLGLGDTLLVHHRGRLAGFALFHSAPLVNERSGDELRVLKLVLDDESLVEPLVPQLAALAHRAGARRAAIRLQGEYGGVCRSLIAAGARVRWTDLRMVLAGHEERQPTHGVALSNWEI